MHITATKIAQWAKTKKSQISLPRLVRRLVHTAGTATQANFPAGDSTSLPGWDGELLSDLGSPWIPKGKSVWELSCEAEATKKANKDYDKRTRNTPRKIRTKATLIAVSARRWSQKARWLKAKRKEKKWADVRAYDADDIEQWLEQNPAVALEFGEELGLVGQGVESLVKHWDGWSQQSDPLISAEAFFIDRQNERERFIAELRHRFQAGQPEFYSVRADSVDEAAAFMCAAILAHADLMAHAVVVTAMEGWRFVETNPSIKIAVAARPEIAQSPTSRNGLIVIIPYAAGDMAAQFRGAASRGQDIRIERPRIHEFETALVSLGLMEADAKRFASAAGRSWSVFRRHHSMNAAIRRPAWLGARQSGALSTLCLLGAWSADRNKSDTKVVSRLSGRAYEDVEKDLRYLSQLDDPPVLLIGDVWKAKSPMELLYLFGDRITSDEFNRFFEIAREILTTPDPVLELPEQDRFAAQVYGKVRPQSDLLIEALCDTLIKLAVRGPQIPALLEANIEGRIIGLVRQLLDDADATRWLSLSSLLPFLAEAAPDAFLKAIEASLTKQNSPVLRLLTETTGSNLTGRCWHAGLLWALETLAWAPDRLTRVALILAPLSRLEIKGNWGNTPLASLLKIFRSWLPQTAADIDQRIGLIDTLATREPDIAFELLDHLLPVGNDVAHPSVRPSWREDDVGAGCGVVPAEQHKMLLATVDRLITCSAGQPHRIARLLGKIGIFDKEQIKATLALATEFTANSAVDEDKEIIRGALRKRIYWHRNYADRRGQVFQYKLQDLNKLYENLLPKDPVNRNKWLFTNVWPELPTGREKDHSKRLALIDSLRVDALREVHIKLGMEGVERLATACVNEATVGVTLAKLDLGTADLAKWVVENGGEFSSDQAFMMTIRGLLRASEPQQAIELIINVVETGTKQGWDIKRTARFLALAPEIRATWDVVTSYGPDVENAYWAITNPGFLLRSDDADFEFALRRLVEAGRPRTALQTCHLDMKEVDARLLAEMLERMLTGQEPDGPLLDSWYIGEALEFLESSGAVDRSRLIRLEFGLIPMIGYGGGRRAKSLYETIMSDPKLFTELLCTVYKPATGTAKDIKSETEKTTAEIAYHVLTQCHCQPGMLADGSIDPKTFTSFIDEVRELCRKADRLDVCDSRLGQILAHAPADANGVWPFEPARNVLDRPEYEKMRHGFQIGAYNKRGSTSRGYDEGGEQERKLANTYRNHAAALRNSHPNVAALLEELAGSYESDGLRYDLEAKLRREGA